MKNSDILPGKFWLNDKVISTMIYPIKVRINKTFSNNVRDPSHFTNFLLKFACQVTSHFCKSLES